MLLTFAVAMRLGLFGGTFDPVHLGHLLVAAAAVEEANLDRLVWVPAGQSPFKPTLPPTNGRLRLRLLRTALAGQTNSEVSSFELERSGPSYSVDTIHWARSRWPGFELYWLIGEDHLPGLPQWKDADLLAKMAEFLVIPRPGMPITSPPPGFRCRRLRGWPLEVSASQIRRRVAAGATVAHLLPAGVAEIIAETGLYRACE